VAPGEAGEASLPARAVRRPVTVLMATTAVAVFGYLSIERLPVELLPDLSYPTLTVQTEHPDAAPVTVEQLVTRPLEEAVGVIPGVRALRSTSRAGLSEVVLEFDWDADMEYSALDVREKLTLVELPEEVGRPRVLRYDPSLDPILRLSFAGDRDLGELRDLAERWLKPRLEAVEGVAAARVRGGLEPEVQVEADAERLAALGLTLTDLAAALRAENVNLPGGTLDDYGSVYLVRTVHEFEALEQVRRAVVRDGPDGTLRVEDVAEVRRGHRDRTEQTRHGGVEAVEVAIHREGAANTVAVAEAVRAELERLRPDLPRGVAVTVMADQSRYVSAAIGEVWSSALVGGLLAVLVLYFFLRDPLSTGIAALAIPASVVATFLPLRQAGVTLNVMSLGGLALGVGMLVDNAIVVLEAIDRRRREGLGRARAAARGAGDVAGAVAAATFTTVSVFLPIVFVKGVAGQLFFDLAVTVCLALLASLVVSLTLIPALAALDPAAVWGGAGGADGPDPEAIRLGPLELASFRGASRPARVAARLLLPLRLVLLLAGAGLAALWWGASRAFAVATYPLARAFEGLHARYPGGLRTALRARWAVLPATSALLVASLSGLPLLGTDLVPDLAQGEFAFRLTLPEGTPLRSTAEVVSRVEEPLLRSGRFRHVFSSVGSLPSRASGRRTTGENLAQVDLVLPPGTSAAEEAAAVERVRGVLSLFPHVEAELVRPQVLSLQPPVEVAVYAEDLQTLDAAAADVAAALDALPEVRDPTTTVEPGSPEVRVEVDRERAAALGLQAAGVGAALRRQVKGEVTGTFREGEDRLDVRVRAAAAYRSRAKRIGALGLRLPDGTSVPVSAVADVVVDQGPAAIHRARGSRVARITAQLDTADLRAALARVEAAVARVRVPPDVVVEAGGQERELDVSFQSLRLALGLATFLVFVVMAVQFESLLHPLVILLAVPLGLVGVMAALLLTGTAVSVLVLIGAVMLCGIVVNNAIVLVDAVNRRRREGQALDDALVGAGEERLRPIVMTTATTVLALLPLALGLGAGGELRRPLAVAVIGGLLGATGLTLVVVPCLYRVMARRRPATTGPGPEAPADA